MAIGWLFDLAAIVEIAARKYRNQLEGFSLTYPPVTHILQKWVFSIMATKLMSFCSSW